jgi:hypothetical protein
LERCFSLYWYLRDRHSRWLLPDAPTAHDRPDDWYYSVAHDIGTGDPYSGAAAAYIVAYGDAPYIVAHDIVAHDIVAHDIVAHDIVAHDIVAHNIVAHDIVAHDIVAHYIVAHNIGANADSCWIDIHVCRTEQHVVAVEV